MKEPLSDDINARLREAASAVVSAASECIIIDATPTDGQIREATARLQALRSAWRAADKAIEGSISGLLQIARSHCKHPGRKYLSDGDYTTCTVCGLA